MTEDQLKAALAAYRRFFAGFNSRDAHTWTAALHFPHVRVSARGPVRVVQSREEATASASWDTVEATGWERSVEREPKIVHVGDHRVHIAGGWTRYTRDHEPILSTFVTYVATRVDGSWGIQARFAVDPGPAGLSDEHVGSATAVVRDYLADWNARRFAEAAGRLNYPAVQVHPGRLMVWNSADEHVGWLQAQPWREIALLEARAVQAGPSAVNLALGLADRGARFEALVLVTLRDGHWGYQAESSVD